MKVKIDVPKITEDGKCSKCEGQIYFTENEFEPSLLHGICKCGWSFTKEKNNNDC